MLVTDVTEKHFDRVIAVNLKGTFFVTQAGCESVHDSQQLWPHRQHQLLRRQDPASGVAIYGAAKAGVISLTKSFALELADYDINSNCVAPGWVESEAVLSGDRWKTYLPQIPVPPSGQALRDCGVLRVPVQRQGFLHQRRDSRRQRRHHHGLTADPYRIFNSFSASAAADFVPSLPAQQPHLEYWEYF